MRWVVAALLSFAPVIASAAECNGAPKPGTDAAGNFRFLRATVERSPAFAVLATLKSPISCSYEDNAAISRITYVSGDARLSVTRDYGGCSEIRSMALDGVPRTVTDAIELLRKDVRHYAPGFEKDVDLSSRWASRWKDGDRDVVHFGSDLIRMFNAQIAGANGAVTHIALYASIGCND